MGWYAEDALRNWMARHGVEPSRRRPKRTKKHRSKKMGRKKNEAKLEQRLAAFAGTQFQEDDK